MQDIVSIQIGSGNVFEDLGMTAPDEMLQKAKLVKQVTESLDIQHISSEQACELLGVDDYRLSALNKKKLTVFSLSELHDFVARIQS